MQFDKLESFRIWNEMKLKEPELVLPLYFSYSTLALNLLGITLKNCYASSSVSPNSSFSDLLSLN